MFFWIGLLLFIIFIFINDFFVFQNKHKLFSYVLLISLFIISALRSHIGNDYDTYVSDFYVYSGYDVFSMYDLMLREPTECLIIYVLSTLGFDYQMLFFVYSAATFFLIIVILRKKYSNYIYILIGILVFAIDYNLMWYSYSIIRQMLAALICLYSVTYLEENHVFKFICCVSTAALWHYSAILFLFIYFIPKKKMNVKLYSLLLLLGGIVYISRINSHIVDYVLSFFPAMERYAWYVYAWQDTMIPGISMWYIYHVILGYFFIYFIKDKDNMYVNIFCAGNFFYLIFIFATPVLRLSTYFYVSLLMLFPLLYKNLKYYKKIILIISMIIPLSITFLKEINEYHEDISGVGITESMGKINYEFNIDRLLK